MAERGIDQNEEKKSYGTVFLLGIALLVALSFWAFWDDNITRRPWKDFQARFYHLDYTKAKAAYDEEDKKLQEDPNFQELSKKLAAAKASLNRGKLAQRLATLEKQEDQADIRFKEIDQEVKFIKSELEEVWYEFDHAVQQQRSTQPYQKRIAELEQERARLEPQLEAARSKREQLKEEIKTILASTTELENELSKLTAERDKWRRVMDNVTFRLGPISFYKIPSIQQAVMEEFDRNRFDQPIARVDRCQSCHIAINRAGFEDQPQPFKTHPRREVLLSDNAHPPEKFGCTPCHEGQGVAVNSVKHAHGEVHLWEFPLLRGSKVQSSCPSCHLDLQRLEDAPLLAQGQRIFEQVGCTGCHLVKGYETIPKIGPSLLKISAKVNPTWMVRWVENPHKLRPRTRMPNFILKESESIAITAYLWSLSKEEGEKWLQEHPLPAGFREGDANEIAKGKNLVETVGCKGCHGFAEGEFTTVVGKDKDLVPNLEDIASKTGPQWIYHWIKDPRAYSASTNMPSLRLRDDEATAITAYLATLGAKTPPISDIEKRLADEKNIKLGESLVRRYGCYGCHEIKGLEKESRIGVELTTFGSKTLDELFFGNRTDIPQTWDDWTFNKIKDPRIYATERIEQLMPQFALAEEDVKALTVVLGGFRERKVGDRYQADQGQRVVQVVEGRRVMLQYNCVGCHEIEKQGGFIRKYYENPASAPPALNGEGEKVQSNWLFGFLKAPLLVRPWLEVRMPTFGFSDQHTTQLVNYFNGLSKIENPYVYFDDKKVPRENLEAARTLIGEEYFNCFSCHIRGAKTPTGPKEGWAPDLTLARQRLSPSWIVKWLQDPQKLEPGTKMPSFYPGGPDNILGGKDDRQIEALRDYVMTLGRQNGAGVAAAPAPPDIAKTKPVRR